MSDDSDDLSAAQAGDDEAFARLYDRHAAVVLALCLRHSIWCPETAEDALQETFLRAFQRLGKVKNAIEFRRWLYGIAKKVCSEQRRKAIRRTRREATVAERLKEDRTETRTPADAATLADQLSRLTAALDALPYKQRLAIHLYYLDADPIATASQALGLSRAGFYKLLAKARNRLAVLMSIGQTA